MRVLVDLNVLLDVIQERDPGYQASAGVLGRPLGTQDEPIVPGHVATTLFYIVRKYASREVAETVVDWLLARFEVLPESREVLLRARSLGMPDFEDAVCASAAEAAGCDVIVTRNLRDFGGSPVPAMLPEEMLDLLSSRAQLLQG